MLLFFLFFGANASLFQNYFGERWQFTTASPPPKKTLVLGGVARKSGGFLERGSNKTQNWVGFYNLCDLPLFCAICYWILRLHCALTKLAVLYNGYTTYNGIHCIHYNSNEIKEWQRMVVTCRQRWHCSHKMVPKSALSKKT